MKNKYTSPELTVVEFRTERGFAESLNNVVGRVIGLDELWQYDQEVMGYNSSTGMGMDGGLGAASFQQESTSGWGLSQGGYF